MLAEAATAATRSFIATAEQLSEMDDWIDHVGAHWGFAEDVVFRARVCAAEVAANVLEHGRAQADWDEIVVTLRPDGPALDVEIADTGRAFDPTRPFMNDRREAQGTPEEDELGGRGLRLLRAYAASMTYRRDGGRNILALRVGPTSHGAARHPPA